MPPPICIKPYFNTGLPVRLRPDRICLLGIVRSNDDGLTALPLERHERAFGLTLVSKGQWTYDGLERRRVHFIDQFGIVNALGALHRLLEHLPNCECIR